MANSTVGSHGGSFAGGFAKAFLAVMQMSMRKRQLDDMHAFYKMMMIQMQHNMAHQDLDDTMKRRFMNETTPWKGTSLEGGGDGYDTSGTADAKGKYSLADMTKMAEKAGFKGDDAAHIAAIAAAESNGNPDAVGKAGEVGLTQVNPHAWSAEDVAKAKTPQGAFDVAFKIKNTQGWGAWSTDPSSPNFTKNNSMERFYGTARKIVAGEKPDDKTEKADSGPSGTRLGKLPTDVGTGAPGSAPADIFEDKPKPSAQADQPFKPYQVAGDVPIPPPTTSTTSPDQFKTGGPELAAATAPVPPVTAPAPDQTITGRTPEMLTPTVGATDPRLQPAPAAAPATAAPAAIPPRGALPPGLVQYDAGGVRGQQPGQGPIYTAGNFGGLTQSGQPLPSTTGAAPQPFPIRPPDPRTASPQQTPPSPAPIPPKRPDNLGGAADTSGNITPASDVPSPDAQNVAMAGGTSDPLWAGYAGASPDQAASADPLASLYSSGQNFSAESGLTDTTGLMAAGQMAELADDDLTATMYKGGPVIKYYRGGVIKRYQDGGDVDSQPPEATPSSAGNVPMNLNDRDTMIRTIAAEAGGEPPIGQAAVAHTILNRVADGGYGDGVQGVIKRPGEFSTWNGVTGFAHGQEASPIVTAPSSKIPNYGAIGSIVDKVHNGLIPDPTNGATHYYAPRAMKGGKPPPWAAGLAKQNSVKVGTQIFVGGSQGPGQTLPSQWAGYYKGGVIKRYAAGGDTDDLLADYGGTDTDDPMANAYWDQQRVNQQLTNNSEASGPDLTTSIQNRAMQPSPQDQGEVKLPPNPLEGLTLGEQPAAAQPTAPPSEQPTAPQPTTEQPTDQPTSQSDIPPGSVQVAGPGGWGSVRDLTNIPLPRVGGMGGTGGMRMPRPSMSMLTGGGRGRTANVGRLGNQPLYTPDHISDDDFNHPGLAPISNSDGNPSVWLLNMVGNGVRALFTGFGLANQGAIPGSPEATDNLNTFLDHNGMDKKDMNDLGDMVDPKHQLYEGGRDIAGAVGMIKYYALTGQLDAASRLAGGVLLYTRMMSMQYGDEAVKSLFNGDYKNAVKSLENGYNWVPDARTAEATDIDPKTGKVHAVQKDGNGKVIAEQDYLPAAIMKAALGLKDGTGYWNMLSSVARAGGNDPLGSHYETQRLLRTIPGNEGVPPDPFSVPPPPKDGTLPITANDGTTPPPVAAPDGTTPAPDATTAPPAPDSTITTPPAAPAAPAISPRDAGGVSSGQAAIQPPQAPPTAIASRGDTSNLVAGPGAPSTATTAPTAPGGSGSVLVAQQQQRELQAQQSAAVDRMVRGGSFDGDDPYVQQKIAEIQKRNLAPLQAYRSQLEQKFADIEGADISPAEKKQLQVALTANIKNFDETRLKPAIAASKQEYGQFASGLKQQFAAKMQLLKRQEKLQDEALTQEKGQVAGQIKYREPRNMDDEQFNLYDGIDKNGRQIIDPTTGERIYGYGDALSVPFNASRTVTTGTGSDGKPITATIPVNPLAIYSRNNPYLSSSYDGKDVDTTFDPQNIKTPEGEPLFTPSTINTMVDAGKDVLKYDKGVDARMVKDLVTGVATANYKIRIDPFNMPRSPLLTHDLAPDVVDENGRMMAPDGVERVNVTISRGPNDPGTTVVMSKNNAFKLQALKMDAAKVAEYNKGMIAAKSAPLDRPIPEPEAVRPPPRSSTSSPPPIPPRGPVWDQPMQF